MEAIVNLKKKENERYVIKFVNSILSVKDRKDLMKRTIDIKN